MYKTEKARQLTFDGFNQSCGMKLNPRDEWVILADMIDWAAVEVEYSALFRSARGRPAASAKLALDALIIIQKRCCGAGLIMTKLSKTTLGSIALSVLVANLFGVQLPLLFFCSISWMLPMGRRPVTCWKSRMMRHDRRGRRHLRAAQGCYAERNPAPAVGSMVLWADTI